MCIPIMPKIDQGMAWGFFDGANQGHPLRCGVDMVLYLNQSNYVQIRYAFGRGSNNKDELLSLRTLLNIAQEKGMKSLYVFKDSKLLIDCAYNKVTITIMNLIPLINDIKEHMGLFDWLSFQHIFRELNMVVDNLSKEDLLLPKYSFDSYEYANGEEFRSMDSCL
jgi:ribonuclease HI